jgi:hypothetical protein
MARARAGRDARGDLYVYVSGTIDGRRVEVKRRVPQDDEALAARVVEEHSRRILLGDLSVLEVALARRKAGRRRKAAPRSSRSGAVTLGAWRDRWLEGMRGQVGEHAWRSYRSALVGAVDALGAGRAIEELHAGDLLELRARLTRAGKTDGTIQKKLAYLRRMLDDAVLAGELDTNPLAVRLPTRRTKHRRRAERAASPARRPGGARHGDRGPAGRAAVTPEDYLQIAAAWVEVGIVDTSDDELYWYRVDWRSGCDVTVCCDVGNVPSVYAELEHLGVSRTPDLLEVQRALEVLSDNVLLVWEPITLREHVRPRGLDFTGRAA